jgi:hypothetical protein
MLFIVGFVAVLLDMGDRKPKETIDDLRDL